MSKILAVLMARLDWQLLDLRSQLEAAEQEIRRLDQGLVNAGCTEVPRPGKVVVARSAATKQSSDLFLITLSEEKKAAGLLRRCAPRNDEFPAKIIFPEQEMARIHYNRRQQKHIAALKKEKSELQSRQETVRNAQLSLRIELKLMQKHLAKQERNKQLCILKIQQNAQDDQALLRSAIS